MDDQAVIVTGASGAIGRATARLLAAQGAPVALVARSEARLHAVADEIRAAGGRAAVVPADLGDDSMVDQVVAAVVDEFGGIGGLVNNAGGVAPMGNLGSVDRRVWWRLFQLNVFGPVALSHATLPALRRSRGRVVNISSLQAFTPVPAMSAYGGAKAALNQITRVLALEEPDVTFVALNPGPTDTPMMEYMRRESRTSMPTEWADRYEHLKNAGLVRSPEVPARLIAWLVLHAPTSMSGSVLEPNDPELNRSVDERFGPSA